jgi:hypothetical protein
MSCLGLDLSIRANCLLERLAMLVIGSSNAAASLLVVAG